MGLGSVAKLIVQQQQQKYKNKLTNKFSRIMFELNVHMIRKIITYYTLASTYAKTEVYFWSNTI